MREKVKTKEAQTKEAQTMETQIRTESRLFQKDFCMVVIGQIISLFGNVILRYALPLYILNKTHSAVLFGTVIACSFIPMILLSPVGGIVADRVNKRNIMVFLDFLTAGLLILFSISIGHVDMVVSFLIMLMCLYGIQGAYQPTVQASIPVLVSREQLMPANAVINLVGSLANLVGPVVGGTLFGFFGIRPILVVSMFCFVCSAIMELFIKIPFENKQRETSILATVKMDMKDSFSFITVKNPLIGKVALILACVNLVFSSLIIIGVPITINEHLGFSQELGNRLYGYAEGALAAGGLLGGILAGIVGKKIKFEQSYLIIFGATLTMFPIGLALFLKLPAMVTYTIIVVCCIVMMLLSTLFSIQMLTFVQSVTPSHLIGKVMSLLMSLVMCAHPLGQIVYGNIFQLFSNKTYLVFLIALMVCILITLVARSVFTQKKHKKIKIFEFSTNEV